MGATVALPAEARVYLVGGAVRDALLGRMPGDRDWVVVGSDAGAMRQAGFMPVGADFPVFLHPLTGEEYALARTERKHGRGHTGFVVHADRAVTLEADLARRDFTINAIAQAPDGTLIDPLGGRADLDARLLRHCSAAFSEDPLRVLRAARFMARLAPLGFRVHPETLALMRAMVEEGELASLVPERVWQELKRALGEARPSAFLTTLRDCGALAHVLPEVDALYGVPQRAEFHPEIDTGIHIEMVVDMAARLAPGDSLVGFAALTHDLGKALTPAEVLPRHPMHEHAGLAPLARLCERLKVPNAARRLAADACREHLNVHRLDELRDATVHDLIERCGGLRQGSHLDALVMVCEADKRGRLGHADDNYPQGLTLRACRDAMLAVQARDVLREGLEGPAVGEALKKARITAIAASRHRPG
jgi:tRNA nucleotidyltransferase (CCA-adding enzyme)